MSGITRKVKIKKVYIHEQIDVTSIEGKNKGTYVEIVWTYRSGRVKVFCGQERRKNIRQYNESNFN